MLGGLTLLLCLTVCLTGSPLDCSDQSDPVVETCCSAQSAWLLMEAAGGCGGAGATESQCLRASELCGTCRAAVEHQDLGALSFEQKLSTLDISFLEMTCVLPKWNSCRVVSKAGFAALFAAGSVLLLIGGGGLAIFHRWALQEEVKRLEPSATHLGQPGSQP